MEYKMKKINFQKWETYILNQRSADIECDIEELEEAIQEKGKLAYTRRISNNEMIITLDILLQIRQAAQNPPEVAIKEYKRILENNNIDLSSLREDLRTKGIENNDGNAPIKNQLTTNDKGKQELYDPENQLTLF